MRPTTSRRDLVPRVSQSIRRVAHLDSTSLNLVVALTKGTGASASTDPTPRKSPPRLLGITWRSEALDLPNIEAQDSLYYSRGADRAMRVLNAVTAKVMTMFNINDIRARHRQSETHGMHLHRHGDPCIRGCRTFCEFDDQQMPCDAIELIRLLTALLAGGPEGSH
jgi:hypothetical protein